MKTKTKKIELGDVVKLKSGSPYMTVKSVDGHMANVIWFDDLGDTWGHERVGSFPLVCLEHQSEDPVFQ